MTPRCPSHDILNSKGAGTGFFCDNGANPCVLEVTEEVGTGMTSANGPPDSTANTAVFPLAFVPQSSGCPSSDPTIQTDSSFSLEHFIPPAVDATCKAAGGVVALNTATDNQSDVSNLTGRRCARSPSSTIPAIRPSSRRWPASTTPTSRSPSRPRWWASWPRRTSRAQTPYPLSKYNLTPTWWPG